MSDIPASKKRRGGTPRAPRTDPWLAPVALWSNRADANPPHLSRPPRRRAARVRPAPGRAELQPRDPRRETDHSVSLPRRARCANGLKVIVMPMPSDGLVAYWTVVRTGSRDEYEPGRTGFAHFFEHMMFRGTERFPTEAYNRIVTTIGADTNAYTTDDHTAYHFAMAAEDLERVMELESDRFQNLKYAESAFQTEAGAVYGEYRKDRTEPRLRARRAAGGHRVREAPVRPHDDGLRARHRRHAEDVRLLAHVLRALLPARQRGAVHRGRGDTGAGVPARREVLRRLATRLRAAADSRGARAKGRAPRRRAVRRPDAAAASRGLQAAGVRPGRQDRSSRSASSPISRSARPARRTASSCSRSRSWITSTPYGSFHRDPYLLDIHTRVKDPAKIDYVLGVIDATVAEYRAAPPDAARLAALQQRLKYGFLMGLQTPESVAARVAQFLAAERRSRPASISSTPPTPPSRRPTCRRPRSAISSRRGARSACCGRGQ